MYSHPRIKDRHLFAFGKSSIPSQTQPHPSHERTVKNAVSGPCKHALHFFGVNQSQPWWWLSQLLLRSITIQMDVWGQMSWKLQNLCRTNISEICDWQYGKFNNVLVVNKNMITLKLSSPFVAFINIRFACRYQYGRYWHDNQRH